MHRRLALQSVATAISGGFFALSRPPAQAMAGAPRARAFVEAADGTRLAVRDWGNSSGRPILFVAPWALCAGWWDRPMTALAAQGWRCLAFDRRGHGRSDEPGRGYDFDTLADDIASVLDSRDLQNVVIVGHSMGGAEVVRYVTRHHSRRVTRVVLIAPTTPITLKTDDNPDGATREKLETSRQNLIKDPHHQVASAAADFFAATLNKTPAEAMEWWTRMIVDVPLKVLIDLHKLMTETDFRPELRTLATPTLIVHGDRDVSANLEKTSRRTQQLIPNSKLIVDEDAGHGLPFTHLDRLIADITAFAA
jgi:non-heme chloroperoxidase